MFVTFHSSRLAIGAGVPLCRIDADMSDRPASAAQGAPERFQIRFGDGQVGCPRARMVVSVDRTTAAVAGMDLVRRERWPVLAPCRITAVAPDWRPVRHRRGYGLIVERFEIVRAVDDFAA